MISHILIFCSILFMSSSLHCMEFIKESTIIYTKKYGTLYTFSSKENYKTFLTLPKELREQIVHPSNKIVGVIQTPKWYNYDLSQYMGTVIKLKLIIPENKHKKIQSPKIVLRQNRWYYCA
jgi:YHS domain-containing protein